MPDITKFLTDWTSIVAIVATGLGALLSLLGEGLKVVREVYVKWEHAVPAPDHLTRRLNDANSTLKRIEGQASLNKVVNFLLVVGQYIVGGTLASSFVQQSISSQLIGSLGVVVLVATLLHQRFRPDLQTATANAKAHFLRSLIREAEDNMAAREGGQTGIPSEIQVIETLSKGLDKVDDDEEWARRVETTYLASRPENK